MSGLAGRALFPKTGDVQSGTPSLLMLPRGARYIDAPSLR